MSIESSHPPQANIAPEAEAGSAKGSWSYRDRNAKLVALGASDSRTVDFAKMVRERHARESRLQLSTGWDIVMDLGSGMGIVGEVIAPHVGQLHCCDISDIFLADCNARLAHFPNVDYGRISYADLSSARGKE
jgi:hypothetical protein